METSLFIPALSKTLPESLLQGLLVFIALKFVISVHKNSTPALRFNLHYGASVLLFAGFLFTLFKHYGEAQTAALNSLAASNLVPSNQIITASKPDFGQILSYWTSHYAYTITSLYLIGLSFCVLRLIIGLINISWLKKNEGQQDDYWTKHLTQLSRHFNLVKTVSVYLSHTIQVPLTIGFIKPVIIFPIALVNQLSVAQTEAILLHELAHIKRADYLLNILLSIIQSFLFFNPMIWLIGREINLYREQCCDDLVLDKTADSLAYAHALLQIETFRNAQLSLALAANGKKYTLLNRIKRITNMEINQPSPQHKLIVLLLTLTTIGLSVAWNIPAKKEIKNLSFTHFKAVKEVYDTNRVEQFTNVYRTRTSSNFHPKITSDKMVFRANDSSGKKLTITGKRMIFDFKADTVIKSKNKFKIVLEDSTGNKKEYNSIDELPTNEQNEFLKENRKAGIGSNFMVLPKMDFKLHSIYGINDSNRLAYIKTFKSNPQWKKQAELMHKQGEAMRKQFNSPEWKKQMEDLRKQSAAIGEQARKQFDTPEFRLKIEKLREESKAMAEQANKQFNSPEFKKQVEVLRLQGKIMGKQGEEMRQYYQSPEWKKQQKKIQKEIEKSQKEWRKNYDEQRRSAMPEKLITPQDL